MTHLTIECKSLIYIKARGETHAALSLKRDTRDQTRLLPAYKSRSLGAINNYILPFTITTLRTGASIDPVAEGSYLCFKICKTWNRLTTSLVCLLFAHGNFTWCMFCWRNKSNSFYSRVSTFLHRSKLVYELFPVQLVIYRCIRLVSWFYGRMTWERNAVRHIKSHKIIFVKNPNRSGALMTASFLLLAHTRWTFIDFWHVLRDACARREEGDMQPSGLGRHAGCLSKLTSVQ